MRSEVWYCWKELCQVKGEDEPRLLNPRSNPYLYEDPFDYLYESPDKARLGLVDWEIDPEESKDWVLCKVTIEPVED